MDVLGKNKHIEYPQKIFEEGLVTVKKGNNVVDYNRVALINCNEKADYTEAKQAMDYLLSRLGLDYQIEEVDHSSFIPGRVGRVVVSGKKVGYIGEINPKVLENFSIDLPVVGFELNLTEIYQN